MRSASAGPSSARSGLSRCALLVHHRYCPFSPSLQRIRFRFRARGCAPGRRCTHRGRRLALSFLRRCCAAGRKIITGTHPEYPSRGVLDACAQFQHGGGRFVYMGGNGFYWRVSYHPDLPGVIEMRRTEDGIRSWMAEDERIGDFGIVGGGAAVGSGPRGRPARDAAACTGGGAGDGFQLHLSLGEGRADAHAFGQQRRDLSLRALRHGVLRNAERWRGVLDQFHRVGGALSHHGYDNNVARITANVLRRFLGSGAAVSGQAHRGASPWSVSIRGVV